MANDVNRQIRLAARPVNYPQESDFSIVESPIPEPREGEVLVQTIWLSLDPYQRGRMRDVQSYATTVELGQVIVGGVAGRIIRSRTPAFREGDIVEGSLGWQEYALSDGSNLRKVDLSLGPLSTALGVLGMPGMTAYFGFLNVGQPRPGDTVVVSAASGAVGQIVGQISKILGCRTVGIAGTQEKIDYIVNELGFDAGINYKTEHLDSALGGGLSPGRGRLLRQCGGRGYRRRFRPPQPGGADLDLRLDFPIQSGRTGTRTEEYGNASPATGSRRGVYCYPVRE